MIKYDRIDESEEIDVNKAMVHVSALSYLSSLGLFRNKF